MVLLVNSVTSAFPAMTNQNLPFEKGLVVVSQLKQTDLDDVQNKR